MKKILLTNDDGYHAKGIKALEQALEEMAEIYVVAPKHEKKCMFAMYHDHRAFKSGEN